MAEWANISVARGQRKEGPAMISRILMPSCTVIILFTIVTSLSMAGEEIMPHPRAPQRTAHPTSIR